MTNVWNEIIYRSDRKRENNLFCIYNKLHSFVVIPNSCNNKYGLNVLFLITKVSLNYRRMLSLLFFKDGFHIYNNKALYFVRKEKGALTMVISLIFYVFTCISFIRNISIFN